MSWVYIGFGITAILFLLALVWPRPDSGTTDGRMGEVEGKFSINNSRPVLKHQAKRNEAIRAAIESKDTVKDALEKSDLRAKHFKRQEEHIDIVHEAEISVLKTQIATNEAAAQNKLDVTAYLAIQQKKALDRLDLDKLLEEMRERVRLAIISEHLSEMQKIALVQEQIDLAYRQIEEVEVNPKLSDATKQRMIDDREEIIKSLKEDRRGRERGLVEAHKRRDVRGVNKAAQLGGDLGTPTGEG